MRHYLATLHTKPDHHKKRFAFLVSAGVTLTMFTVWSLVTFGTGGTLAQNDPSTTLGASNSQIEVSPFESFREGLASSFDAMKESFEDLFLNIYGQ